MRLPPLDMPTPRTRCTRLVLAAAIALLASMAAIGQLAVPPAAHAAKAVVGGDQVSAANWSTRWPWLVALVDHGTSNVYAGQFCGGSLIAPRIVMTAAHCTENPAPAQVDVVIGRRRLSLPGGERIAVVRTVRPPGWDPDTLHDDVALLELASPAATTPVSIVGPGDESLWGNGAGLARDPGLGPWIAGWGNTCSDQGCTPAYPDIMEEAAISLQSDATCAAAASGGSVDFWAPSMVCAGQLDSTPADATVSDGIDTCQGDSGGPLTVSDGVGGWKVAGITSWGVGCAGSVYGMYTRVAAMRSWIDTQLGGACGFGTGVDTCAPPVAPGGGGGGGTAGGTTGGQPVAPAAPTSPAPAPAPAPRADTTAPAAPGPVVALRRTQTTLTIRWSAAADDVAVTGYTVARLVGGRWVHVGTTRSLPAAFGLGGLRRGAIVHVQVRAFDAAGNLSAPRSGSYRLASR